jgi:glutamyl-tRNA reductase
MSLYALGLNHQTAPLAVRERVVFHVEKLYDALLELTRRRFASEAAILSTCNRTEIYFSAGESTQAAAPEPAAIVDWLTGYHRLKPGELTPYLYTLPREQSVRHAFRVASGLDSMVLGEPQILGQMKEAARTAEAAGTLGTVLHKLFQRSFAVAKEVRSTTQVGANSVSMASAAVKLAARIFPSLREQQVLLIGAGEMIELCATHFAAQAPARITVANRTLERAESLARRFNGHGIELRALGERLAEYDIVVTSTASSLPILGKGMVERALRARRRRPMFMVDLAVPRDVEAEVGDLDDVFLFTLDDLFGIVSQNIDARRSAVEQAEAIIETQVGRFMHWMSARESVPVIRSLREHADEARRHELERALRLLARGDDPKQVLESLSQGLANKLLHSPSQVLHDASGEERARLVEAAERLFGIKR